MNEYSMLPGANKLVLIKVYESGRKICDLGLHKFCTKFVTLFFPGNFLFLVNKYTFSCVCMHIQYMLCVYVYYNGRMGCQAFQNLSKVGMYFHSHV